MSARVGSLPRRHDLDWLRVLAIASVFVYHSFRFFNLGDWSVKNDTTYPTVEALLNFAEQWMMPLIFLISGASIYYAVGKGGPGRFLWDKVLRLLVPLAVCAFTHASLQVYLERLSHGQFGGSYLEFLPHYFEGLYFPGGSGNFAFHGMHLWYLLFLFLFSLILLPVFFGLKSDAGGRLLRRMGDFLALPGAVVLLALPTIVLENTLDRGSFLGGFYVGGWTLPHYLWFFFAGFVVISHERLQQRICQARWLALALALALVAGLALSGRPVNQHPDLLSWALILAILGFGMRHLTFRVPFLDYANEAVLPFYILHQSVLLWVGYFVVQWAISDPVKYLAIAVSSFAAIMALYEFLVRRNDVLRFLFGMHRRRAAKPARPVAPREAAAA